MSTGAEAGGKKEVKILMFHGFTQSGNLFRAKTRALEKLLVKALAPVNLAPVLIYPTGPVRLRPSELPGFDPASLDAEGSTADDDSDHWAWFRKDESSGAYRQLDRGMATAAAAIRDAGGVDGCCGFSQGGAVAGIVAAAMEPERALPEGEGEGAAWARELREANGGRPLRFAVSYSGFFGPVDALKFCYEPPIVTPTMHFYGSLDTVVEEDRTRGLIDRCRDPVVVAHPGGHYVPVSKEYAMALAGFIRQHAVEAAPPKVQL